MIRNVVTSKVIRAVVQQRLNQRGQWLFFFSFGEGALLGPDYLVAGLRLKPELGNWKWGCHSIQTNVGTQTTSVVLN